MPERKVIVYESADYIGMSVGLNESRCGSVSSWAHLQLTEGEAISLLDQLVKHFYGTPKTETGKHHD
jgi:hypothetical protein